MTVQYGLTPAGFVVKQQSEIQLELETALQGVFGNVNFDPRGPMGQLTNIFAERLAEVWQLAEAVYASRYPAGAEGQDVDNILALNNMKRLPALATTTAPTTTTGTPGLILFGAPGTVVDAGVLIGIPGSLVQFTLDNAVTIQNPQNAVELISFYGGLPNSGTWVLSIVDATGVVLTTPDMAYNASANTTFVAFGSAPASGSWYLQAGALCTSALPYNATAADVQSALQTLSGYASATVTGSIAAGFTISWAALSQPVVQSNAELITFGSAPTAGAWSLTLGAYTTAGLLYNATAAQVQGAINALPGYGLVSVAGSIASGFSINWGWSSPPIVSVASNTTGATITPGALNSTPASPSVANSVQGALNTLYDAAAASFPYSDLSVSGNFSLGFSVTFGALSPLPGQPSSGGQAQSAFTAISAIFAGYTLINISAQIQAQGASAQGVGSATCTQTGANYVAAGTLTTIINAISGWTGITNPLDCITGAAVETDTEALARRASLLVAQANGPLASIVERVLQLPGVVSVTGFANASLAAQQHLAFSATPTGGFYTLSFLGPRNNPEITAPIAYNALANAVQLSFSVLPSGGFFTLTLGNTTTADIPNSATALTVQAAINALPGYNGAVVSGSFASGFLIYFTGLSIPGLTLANSLTPATVDTLVGSVQSAINALPDYGPVRISGSSALGFVVDFGQSAGGIAQALSTVNDSSLVGAVLTSSFGLPGKSFKIVVNDNNGAVADSLIASTILGAKPATAQSYGATSQIVTDAYGNQYLIAFSRPTQVPIYIALSIQTDLFTPVPTFSTASLVQIQDDLAAIGSTTQPGGVLRGLGTNGLIGAFNNIAGVLGYTLYFGTSPNPILNTPIAFGASQVPLLETYNIIISYS